MMELVVCKEIPVRLPSSRLRRLFDLVVRSEGKPRWAAHVNLVICSDTRIRNLNRRFRKIDRPTDVLSFNLDGPEEAGDTLGEIYIAWPYVRRQAARQGNSLHDEFLLLFCHGLLHLFGHDHDTSTRESAMFERQARHLQELKERS
jgi:probable rRNA maturation factor